MGECWRNARCSRFIISVITKITVVQISGERDLVVIGVKCRGILSFLPDCQLHAQSHCLKSLSSCLWVCVFFLLQPRCYKNHLDMTRLEGCSRQSKESREKAGAARCGKLLTTIRIFLFNLGRIILIQHMWRLKLKLKTLNTVFTDRNQSICHVPESQICVGFMSGDPV